MPITLQWLPLQGRLQERWTPTLSRHNKRKRKDGTRDEREKKDGGRRLSAGTMNEKGRRLSDGTMNEKEKEIQKKHR